MFLLLVACLLRIHVMDDLEIFCLCIATSLGNIHQAYFVFY